MTGKVKYELSEILLRMKPCPPAAYWIEHEMHFETFEEAIRACPESHWLVWVLDTLGIDDSVSRRLGDEMWRSVYRVHEPPADAFLSPKYVGRLARALVRYAQAHGITPKAV